MRWWHKLNYWKKGTLIGFIIGIILIPFIMKMGDFSPFKFLSEQITIYYTLISVTPGLGHLIWFIAWIFGNKSFITQIFLFISGGLPTAIIGGLIGWLIAKRKNVK